MSANAGPQQIGQQPGAKSGAKWGLIALIVGVVGCLGIFLIGIVAAIAIPNFVRFGCKAKQSEAKTNLSGLYTAERSYYAEHGFYTSDLKAVDWVPDGKPVYVYGFSRPGPNRQTLSAQEKAGLGGSYDDGRKDTASSGMAGGGFSSERMVDPSGVALTGESLPSDAVVVHDHFRAGAAGNLGQGKLDVWEIDDSHVLTNLTDGCH